MILRLLFKIQQKLKKFLKIIDNKKQLELSLTIVKMESLENLWID